MASVNAVTSIQRRDSSSELGRAHHASSRSARSGASISRQLLTAPPERGQAAREGARRDRAAVSREDARGQAIPERASLEEQVGRGGRDRGQRPVDLARRVEDGDQLAGQELESIGGQRGERGQRALAQQRRFAEHPIEQGALQLLDLAGEATERARGVHPNAAAPGGAAAAAALAALRPTSS